MMAYLRETEILDFNQPEFNRLSDGRGWMKLDPYNKIRVVYEFVQNEIAFGYNASDDIRASRIFRDGYGQCNTKTALSMALFRKLEIPCRFHGFMVDKSVQRGVISGVLYLLAPRRIIHSWTEVYFQDRWVNLEGFILDKSYLQSLQHRFQRIKGPFCGYGVAAKNLQNPQVDWQGDHTYIQNESIVLDLGVFDSPDDFYRQHGANLRGVRGLLFKYGVRRIMNRNVQRIRKSGKEISCPRT
ncbi:MAG: transglutaminase domain-containing protein [Deltaproteobacteria bacterium]|nr:transglutaminase domain-containing protein [Deltaproteobacteria bacterium]